MEMMKAIRIGRFGGPEVLEHAEVPIPQPLDDEVLVRVAAASVNPVDYKTREGQFPPVTQAALPVTLGRDLAGTIEAVGTRAHYMLAEGEPVFALIAPDRGAQADYVVVKALELVAAPRSLDLAEAAAVPLAALTAWQGLFDHGGVAAGQRVLIHGGAGGVGHLAIQFAKARGATVFATCAGRDLDFVRDLGADEAIDYQAERFEDRATAIDMVFDLVGGDTQRRSWAVLREGGILVSTLAAPDPAEAAAHKARAAPRYMAEPNTGQLGEIAALIDAGTVRIMVSERFAVADAALAYARIDGGGVRGKIVLTWGSPA